MKFLPDHVAIRVTLRLGFLTGVCMSTALWSSSSSAQETVDVGKTGFSEKKPVLASACPHGCPWGELGDYVKEAMVPFGYEVILCRNCNRDQGPRIVAKASMPPELGAQDTFVGTTTRVNASVDFGITESGFLAQAYAGKFSYASDGPFQNLRLIAKIEDPTYLLAAVKADSPITDLKQFAERKMPVKILGGSTPISQPVLEYYGLTSEAVASWGGSFTNPIVAGAVGGSMLEFDLILNELASPANNPESSVWGIVSQKQALRFLDISDELLGRLADDKALGVTRVTAQWGLLRGVDRPIPTVARSGHAIFARDDAPDQAIYDAAKAIDEHRAALKWFIRPYSYDSQTAWQNFDVPLHPGAEKYYRERGYMRGAATSDCAAGNGGSGHQPSAGADASTDAAEKDGGCSVSAAGARGSNTAAALFFGLAVAAVFRARQRRRA